MSTAVTLSRKQAKLKLRSEKTKIAVAEQWPEEEEAPCSSQWYLKKYSTNYSSQTHSEPSCLINSR